MDDKNPQDPSGQSQDESDDRVIAEAPGRGRDTGLTMIRTGDGGRVVFNAAGRVEYASSPHVVAEARQRLQSEQDRSSAAGQEPRPDVSEPAGPPAAAADRPDVPRGAPPTRVLVDEGGNVIGPAPAPTPPAGRSVFHPADIGDPQGRHQRLAAVIPLQETYLTQGHRWNVEQRWIELRPTGEPSGAGGTCEQPPPEGGDPIDRWLVTAWNPRGKDSTAPQNFAATGELVGQARALGAHPVRTAATLPPDRGWVEQTLVLRDIDEAAAVRLGWRFGQAAVTLWRGETLTIVPTGLTDDVQRETVRCVHELLPPVCPIKDTVPEHLCWRPRFCPGTSGAIHHFALRAEQRRLFVLVTGCPVCQDVGETPTIDHLNERLVVASRHGGYVWAPWEA